MKIHNCPNCNHEAPDPIGQICLRCNHTWLSKLVKPAMCPKCKSSYWHKPRIRALKRYPEIYALSVGESVVMPWPQPRRGGPHPVFGVIARLTAAGRGRFWTEPKSDGVHVKRLSDDSAEEVTVEETRPEMSAPSRKD